MNRAVLGLNKGCFSNVVLLGCKRVRFGLQKESFLENKAILSEKQGNLECFSIFWIEPQIVGGYGVLAIT